MSQDPRGPGSADTGLAERAEALLDEAVGLAAKGGYGEAADKAHQALAIDPDNTVARDLLASYRHQVADDDERRRRRRSIAAAAAAIEEMVESDRIDEASTATDVLALQFGTDAPVDELRRRIVESRAAHLDFHDLDAAIDAIRVPGPQSSPSPPARLDAAGALSSEIEEHLRAGRLEDANRLVGRLESEPGAKERAKKLRTRIEDATHVAAEHRREEEILIATAAIEERLRRGSIDDAATRLDQLAASHGASAPVAELRERLDEARAREDARALGRAEAASGAAEVTATADQAPVDSTLAAGAPVFGQSMVEAESRGPGRWIAIAAVVALLIAGGWWMLSRPSDRSVAPSGAEPSAAAADPEAAGDSAGVVPNRETSTGVPPAANAIDGSGIRGAAPSIAGADAARSTSGGGAATTNAPKGAASSVAGLQTGQTAAPAAPAPAPAAAVPAAPTGDRAETQSARADVVPPSAEVAPPSGGASDASAPPASADAAAPPVGAPAAPPDGTTQVVVEPVPAAQPPIEAPPPPVEAAPAPSSAGDTAAAATRSAAPTESQPSAPPPPPASGASERAAAEPPARPPAAPPPATAPASAGPVVLGCGEPGVVCLKSVTVPTPHYPAQARARKLTADVVVMALVDEQGRVIQTRVDRGSFVFFNEAAIEAAKRAVFQPASRNGVPGRSWAKLTFRFDQQ